MRRFLKIFLLSSLLGANISVADQPFKLMITQIVEHDALNAVREGALEVLKEEGFKQGENLKVVYESAQGQISIAKQIAQKFSGEDPSVILAISTPSAQAVVSTVSKDVPVVFSAITDPVEAKLLKNMENPEGNVTGVTDKPPFNIQFKFIQKLLPEVKKIGIIYNPGEANSQSSLKEILRVAKEQNLEIVESAIMSSSDVGGAAHHLVGKVDAIYIPNDNKVVSSLESIIKVGTKHKLPVFTADVLLVERGAAPMIGVDYHEIGRQTGKIIVRLLKGESPKDIPVEHPENLVIRANPLSAEKMGVPLPKQVGLFERDFKEKK